MNELDKVVTTTKTIVDKNGNSVVEVEKHIICSVCGHSNKITASQCTMCSNFLEIEEEEDHYGNEG